MDLPKKNLKNTICWNTMSGVFKAYMYVGSCIHSRNRNIVEKLNKEDKTLYIKCNTFLQPDDASKATFRFAHPMSHDYTCINTLSNSATPYSKCATPYTIGL